MTPAQKAYAKQYRRALMLDQLRDDVPAAIITVIVAALLFAGMVWAH